MAEETLIQNLMQFGLTRQEAAVYLCLCGNGALTGYEAAKLTGISRSNVYSALAGLAEKGAAGTLEGTPVRYLAVKPEEYTENFLRCLKELRKELISQMPKSVETTEGYINIEGERHILDKIGHMLQETGERCYISAAQEIIILFADQIAEIVKRKKKFVILSEGEELLREAFSDKMSEDEYNGIILYKTKKKDRQFRLIIDSRYVLTGELDGGSTALYSAQPNFVNVFKEAMHNEIKLIELTGGADYE